MLVFSMIKIEKRSNQTRTEERPPKTIYPASLSFLAEIHRLAVKPIAKSGSPLRKSREERWVRKEQAENDKSTYPLPQHNPSAGSPVRNRLPANNLPAQNTPPKRAPWNSSASGSPSAQPAQSKPSNNAVHSWPSPQRNRQGMNGPASTSPSRLPKLAATPLDRSQDPKTVNVDTQEKPQVFVEAPQSEDKIIEPVKAVTPPVSLPPAIISTPVSEPPVSLPARSLSTPALPPLNLEQLLARYPDLPAQTAILGVSDDALPVLLDLNDPTPGAVLVIGDERAEQLQMLQTAVASVVKRNSPRGVQFLVISNDPGAWQTWVSRQGFDRYCLTIEDSSSDTMVDWIIRLADWTEQRRLGQREGPPILLVMDTLNFLPKMQYDLRLNFEWMAKEGPQAQIWPLATVSTDLAKVLYNRRLLRSFQTRVFASVDDPSVYVQAAGLDERTDLHFDRAGQYAVRVGEDWLRFQMPR